MATGKTVDPSTRNFKKLFELTKQTCSIDPSISYRSIVQKKTERWNLLLDIWRKSKKNVGSNIFRIPLENVLGGRSYCGFPPQTQELLREIEEVLLNDNEAFNVWVHTRVFRSAYERIIQRSCGLIEYQNFLYASGTLRLLNGKTIIKTSRTPRSQAYYLLEPGFFLEKKGYCDEFKALFSKVLPGSVKWTDEQWRDYHCVFDCINNTYGVNFNTFYSALNPVYYLLKYSVNFPGFVDVDEFVKAPFNYNLVKALLPKNTDYLIYKLFSRILTVYKHCNRVDDLMNSWILKILELWTEDEKHNYYSFARKAVVDIKLGYFGNLDN